MAIRVLIAEDSLTVRHYLLSVFASDPVFEVIGMAEDGRQAIELCQLLRPDVMTIDMMMPEVSGQQVTEQVMAYFPTPIVIVSSSFNRGELFKTYEALAAGAVDVIDKPAGDAFDAAWETRFLETVRVASRIKVITHLRGRNSGAHQIAIPNSPAGKPGRVFRAVALGASTGGPAALVEILQALPADYPLPILIVLHLGQPFGTTFAEWLDSVSPIRVKEAVDDTPLLAGPGVTLAPPGRHMILREGRIRLTDDPVRNYCRPSVDPLFESLAQELGRAAVGCLLTGMGIDGAAGLLAVKKSGGVTLAQDEATCVVFGMPRQAILLGAAGRVLPLREFAPALRALANRVESKV